MLSTERLIIRKATENDASFLFELINSPSWIAHIGDRGIRTIEDAKAYIHENMTLSYQTHGYGPYIVTLSGLPIGLCGLIKRTYLPLPDLGFALLENYAGRGYIQEAGAAVLAFAFSDLKLKKILAITSEENSASQATLIKLGFKSMGKVTNSEGSEHLLFETQKKVIPRSITF